NFPRAPARNGFRNSLRLPDLGTTSSVCLRGSSGLEGEAETGFPSVRRLERRALEQYTELDAVGACPWRRHHHSGPLPSGIDFGLGESPAEPKQLATTI